MLFTTLFKVSHGITTALDILRKRPADKSLEETMVLFILSQVLWKEDTAARKCFHAD